MQTRISLWLLWICVLLAFSVVATVGCGGASYSRSRGDYAVPASAMPNEAQEQVSSGASDSDDTYGYAFDERVMAEPIAEYVSGGSSLEADKKGTAQVVPKPTTSDSAAADSKPSSSKGESAVASDAVPIQQVLIYTAELTMAVYQVDKSMSEVEAIARNLGGFLATRTDTRITIRVPAAQFDDALKGIGAMGDVLSRNVQVDDVTEEYLDVLLRLKNARQVRERIAQLLANAKTVEESLQVERELHRLSAEIERMEGRLKYLRDKARYSTITVTFRPLQADVVGRPFQLPFPWLRNLGLGGLMDVQ